MEGTSCSRSQNVDTISCSSFCPSSSGHLPRRAQQPQLSPPKRAQIESAVTKFMASTHVPGLSVAVVENGEYEWAAALASPTPRTTPPPASTRSFAWRPSPSHLLRSAPCNSGSADNSISTLPSRNTVPPFPQKPQPITTRAVMGHLAGIRHYKTQSQDDPEVGNTKHFDNPIQAGLDFFKNDPLVSEPGKQFHYSTQGYTLGRLRHRRSFRRQVRRLHAPKCFRSRRHGAHPGRRPLRHHSLPHALLREDRVRHRAERRLPRLQLQDSRRRMAFLRGRHGELRSRHPRTTS